MCREYGRKRKQRTKKNEIPREMEIVTGNQATYTCELYRVYVCTCVAAGYYDGLTRQQPGSSACCMEAASLSLFRRESSPER